MKVITKKAKGSITGFPGFLFVYEITKNEFIPLEINLPVFDLILTSLHSSTDSICLNMLNHKYLRQRFSLRDIDGHVFQ